MKDLADARLMFGKAALLFVIGASSATLLLIERPAWKTAVLLALVIWSFARVYYFAFYVIERYIDPTFRFSGLFAVARYLIGRRSLVARRDPDARRP